MSSSAVRNYICLVEKELARHPSREPRKYELLKCRALQAICLCPRGARTLNCIPRATATFKISAITTAVVEMYWSVCSRVRV